MAKNGLWARLGGFFRPAPAIHRNDEELPPVGDDGLLAASFDGHEPSPPAADKPISRWTRRDHALQQLQDGYARVTDLIDAMQKHLAIQGERTERIASSLDHLARSLGHLPENSRQQAQTLDTIASHLELTNARTQQLAESVRGLPGATKAQSEVLAGMTRQLELGNETTVQLRNTLQTLGVAVETLRESSNVQAESLRRIQREGEQREDRLADVITHQQRRFTMLFVITLIFALLGACAGVTIIVVRLLQR